MSSTAYAAEIRPDRKLRCFVLATGLAVALLGTLAIVSATVPFWARMAALVLWVVYSWREMVALRRGWQRCHGVRFLASGDVEIRSGSGAWEQAELADGSVLLRRFGWLRFSTNDGTGVQELIRGCCRKDRDWRRLHVIWRHV